MPEILHVTYQVLHWSNILKQESISLISNITWFGLYNTTFIIKSGKVVFYILTKYELAHHAYVQKLNYRPIYRFCVKYSTTISHIQKCDLLEQNRLSCGYLLL